MYYRLKKMYALRGWKKEPYMLVKRPQNQVRRLRREDFQALLLCDGMTEMDAAYVSDPIRQALKRYEEAGVIGPCPGQKSLEEDQNYRYYDNRYVRSVFWSVTGRCNYKCRHCYMDAPEGRLGELTCEQALALIDQMAACGVLCVDITGGEPFVRDDLWTLIDRILSHKMAIGQVYTNGWLLSEPVLDAFERRGLKPEICISFDGVGWHDWMRGVRGAEAAVVRAMELCKQHGFPVRVEMCVHKGNQDTLAETVELLADLGIASLRVGTIARTPLWERNGEGKELDVREYAKAMLAYIPQFFRAGMPMNVTLSGIINLRRHSKEYVVVPMRYSGSEDCKDRLLCGAARYTCYITPQGRLLPCMPMTACREQELFPLTQEIGLQRGLDDSFYMKIVDSRVRDLLAVNDECRACEHKYSCGGGCRASALEQSGDLMGCDRTLCMLWKEGYVERIKEAAEEAVLKYCG